jgi:hypothetical protein
LPAVALQRLTFTQKLRPSRLILIDKTNKKAHGASQRGVSMRRGFGSPHLSH